MSAKMINCKSCGNEIASNAKTCPGCGAKNSKPIFKKWWFWLIIVLFIGGILGSSTDDNDTTVDGSKTVAADGNATSEQVNTETWKKSFYVDEFDELTDEWFVSREFTGTFSNSAATNSPLSGQLVIDSEKISIFLFKYYKNQVKNPYSFSQKYEISVRLENGSTSEFTSSMHSDGDRILVTGSSVETLKELLKNGGKIKFYICEADNSITNYLFEISSDNLKDIIG
ncbi:MAG: zinc ribbon domain-containing protein [Clostridia bacterium]|nr:zinc ribbon domain-containing protein [Clostridia bacterium]